VISLAMYSSLALNGSGREKVQNTCNILNGEPGNLRGTGYKQQKDVNEEIYNILY
jgi:hypothetical protein